MRVLKGTTFGERMDECGFNIYGWTQGNYTTSTANGSNLPMTFNNRSDFWQMNQNFLRLEREIDMTKKQFQVGFRTDWILPGTDSQFTISRGLLDSQLTSGPNGGPVAYPIDLFQAYMDFYLPSLGGEGTTVRVGKFATHVGYELVEAVGTPFVSRAYNFQYNPFTHTGVWAITPVNDNWTASYGLSVGSDNFIGEANQLTFLGQLKWAPKEGKTSAALNVVVTNPEYNVSEMFPAYNVYNLLLTHQFTDKFTGVLDATFSHMDSVPGVGSANWYGFAGYGIYSMSDKVVLTLRQELFEDTQGVRTGFSGLYNETTLGLAYSPCRSLILRPSARFDYNFQSKPWNGNAGLFSAAMDVIVRW